MELDQNLEIKNNPLPAHGHMRKLRPREGESLPGITQQVGGRGRSSLWGVAPAFLLGDGGQQWLSAPWAPQVKIPILRD